MLLNVAKKKEIAQREFCYATLAAARAHSRRSHMQRLPFLFFFTNYIKPIVAAISWLWNNCFAIVPNPGQKCSKLRSISTSVVKVPSPSSLFLRSPWGYGVCVRVPHSGGDGSGTNVPHFVIPFTIHCSVCTCTQIERLFHKRFLLSGSIYTFFSTAKWCSHKTFQWNEFVGCSFTFLVSTERCGWMEQSENLNNIYCCFCIWNSPSKRTKERMKKFTEMKKIKSEEAKQLLFAERVFQFDVHFSSVTGDHHITCGHKASVCVYVNVHFLFLLFLFFSLSHGIFCEYSRRSVWHFHFAQAEFCLFSWFKACMMNREYMVYFPLHCRLAAAFFVASKLSWAKMQTAKIVSTVVHLA